MFVKKFLPVVIAGLVSGICSNSIASDKNLSWITLGDAAFQQLKKITPSATSRASIQPEAGFASVAANEKVHLVQVTDDQMFALSHAVHKELNRCGGFLFHPTEAAGLSALSGQTRAGFAAAALTPTRPSYNLDNASIVTPMLAIMQDSNIAATINDLSSFVNRYYQTQGGVDSSAWLLNKWKTMSAGRSDISVAQFTHPSWKQKSVILTIQGTDNANEIVVLGGHLDSINLNDRSETARAPGADDDASGIASMTEVLRAMVTQGYKPRRTIKMMAYAAEEVGLRGSQEIADSFAAAGSNVVGMMQLDMTNYKGAVNDIYIFTDYTDSLQNTFVKNIISTYLPGVKVGSDKCGYACSDHASWFNKGYATTMPFESSMTADNPNIHTPNDTYANSGNQALHALKFARMAAAFAVELGSDGTVVTPPVKTETFTGSLVKGASKTFGPFNIGSGNFKVSTTGTGDIDLYSKTGVAPTKTSYACKSDGATSTESCSITSTAKTTGYVLLNAYTAGNYTLTVTYPAQ